MKKLLNKNGFMFIETIVTLTILMVVLLMLYTTFTNLLNKEKTITTYDKKGYVYSLYYAKEYLLDKGLLINLKNNVYFPSNWRSQDRASLKQYILYAEDDEVLKNLTKTERENFYLSLKNDLREKFGINKLEFINSDVSGFSSNRSIDDSYSTDFSKYENMMVPTNSAIPNNVVKLVAEFYDEVIDEYFYVWIYYPNI